MRILWAVSCSSAALEMWRALMQRPRSTVPAARCCMRRGPGTRSRCCSTARAAHHVVRAMLPMVRVRTGREDGEALEVYSKFSRELGLYVELEVLGDRVAAVRLARKAPRETAGSDHPYLARILEHIHTGNGDLRDIPVDLEVAPFEREVLDFLRTIPPGETITYGEIARRLGRPGASRAVGTACARNPAVIVIPCHRVVPKSGGLGNYSSEGGPETKRKLLKREGASLAVAIRTHPARRDPNVEARKRPRLPRRPSHMGSGRQPS